MGMICKGDHLASWIPQRVEKLPECRLSGPESWIINVLSHRGNVMLQWWCFSWIVWHRLTQHMKKVLCAYCVKRCRFPFLGEWFKFVCSSVEKILKSTKNQYYNFLIPLDIDSFFRRAQIEKVIKERKITKDLIQVLTNFSKMQIFFPKNVDRYKSQRLVYLVTQIYTLKYF